MVRRARKSTRRPRRRAAGKRVARKSKRSSTSQYATIKETIEFADLTPNSSNKLAFNLSQFTRASALAPNFRWYKAAKVEWSLEPLYNTFTDGVGTDSVPFLYQVMNRTQDSLNINLHDIQGMGAKPIKLTGKKVKSYVPNWCSSGLTTYTVNPSTQAMTGMTAQGLRAQYSYLATPQDYNLAPDIPQSMVPIDPRNPVPAGSGMNTISVNQVLYNGHYVWIDQYLSGGTDAVCRCTATVTWHFKDPKYNAFVRDPVPIQPKEVN